VNAHVRQLHMAFDSIKKPKPTSKQYFVHSRAIEKQLTTKLRSLAKHIADIVKGVLHLTGAHRLASIVTIRQALSDYAKAIEPWARSVLRSMHARALLTDDRHWRAFSSTMGRALHEEVASAPVGDLLHRLMEDQVTLIKSLPLEAAEWVHEQTLEALEHGGRPQDLVQGVGEKLKDFRKTTTAQVKAKAQKVGTKLSPKELAEAVEKRVLTRARLIARTETARTSSLLTQARAIHLGSPGYFWHSARDGTVRPTHRALDEASQKGQMFAWDEPPVCDRNKSEEFRAHPGQIWNCRCWAVPVIPN
jgi:SPP1 gp7 family putative phage head morphogenesis protein